MSASETAQSASETAQSASETAQSASETALHHFKRGFARVDRDSLARAVTDDFEWHLHWYESEDDEPTGRVLRGLDEVMAEIERRRDHWSDLRYTDVEERHTEDMIVQTFVVSGVDAGGRRFHSSAVDLYPLRDGLIAKKQTYWKQHGAF